MALFMLNCFALLLALLPCPGSAWAFLWTNASNESSIAHGSGNQGCTPMSLAQGKVFDWDPEGSSYCVSIQKNSECTEEGGFFCTPRNQQASRDFPAFLVKTLEELQASQASASSTPTATSSSTSETAGAQTSSTNTASDTPTDNSSSSSSLSGGAIAGIVVGVVAGVAIVAGICYFCYRKGRKASMSAAAAPEAATEKPKENPPTTSPVPANSKVAPEEQQTIPPTGTKVVELAGNNISELADNNQISELEGSNKLR